MLINPAILKRIILLRRFLWINLLNCNGKELSLLPATVPGPGRHPVNIKLCDIGTAMFFGCRRPLGSPIHILLLQPLSQIHAHPRITLIHILLHPRPLLTPPLFLLHLHNLLHPVNVLMGWTPREDLFDFLRQPFKDEQKVRDYEFGLVEGLETGGVELVGQVRVHLLVQG